MDYHKSFTHFKGGHKTIRTWRMKVNGMQPSWGIREGIKFSKKPTFGTRDDPGVSKLRRLSENLIEDISMMVS